MSRLLIPGLFAVALGLAAPAFAQTTATTSAQPQSDYDRVMKGVDATTAGVTGPQPGAATKTITTKTVNGPFPLPNTAGIGVNNATGFNNGGGYGGYGRAGGYGAGYGTGGYPTAPVPAPDMGTSGTSTTTTTITDDTAVPAQ